MYIPERFHRFRFATADESDIMTAAHLRSICEIENILLADDEYRNFCKLNYADASNPTCVPPPDSLSASYFYAAYTSASGAIDCKLLSEAEVA
jgi:hypothetical protein